MPSDRRFNNQEHCRQAIAWVFRELERDRMKPDKARVLIYAALSVSGILSEHDLEKRVEALEGSLPSLRRSA